ncbi:MAG: 4-hydroxy-tetrahydrodipicolinate synthase [Alistipes sp.]|jgi:4-hydroxy-tetrahydrodipicolinate synthase|nr:4-hydroxy-tetrahydrodipicolinate synthase [Alistipes sp.]
MRNSKFKGIGVALATPFDSKGEVDFDALGRIVDHVIEGGVDFLVALGTTAETPTLSRAERAAVAKYIGERNAGRKPLVLGMGGNDTAGLCADIKAFDTAGFDAILSVAPYYNKPTQEGLFRHYRAVAEASPLPVILYNIPGRTGVNITAETTLRIARQVPSVIGVKEASGDIDQMKAILAQAPEDFLVISGDDAMVLPLVEAGGHGLISVLANALPAQTGRMVHAALDGDTASARAMEPDLAAIIPLLFAEGNPTGVKTALDILGVCRPDMRLPLVEGSPALRAEMTKYLAPFLR